MTRRQALPLPWPWSPTCKLCIKGNGLSRLFLHLSNAVCLLPLVRRARTCKTPPALPAQGAGLERSRGCLCLPPEPLLPAGASWCFPGVRRPPADRQTGSDPDSPKVLTPENQPLLIFYALNFKHQRGARAARQGGFGHYTLSRSFFPSSPSRQDYGSHLLILVWEQHTNLVLRRVL